MTPATSVRRRSVFFAALLSAGLIVCIYWWLNKNSPPKAVDPVVVESSPLVPISVVHPAASPTVQSLPVAPRVSSPVGPALPTAPAARIVAALAAVAPASPVAVSQVVSVQSENNEEATRRMIAAHAPLRTRDFADPDSEANRRILTQMMQKAVLRKAAAGQP